MITVLVVLCLIVLVVGYILINPKGRFYGSGIVVIALSLIVLFLIALVAPMMHAADMKPKMFPTSEARLLEQELVNAHIKRQTLPSVKADVYRCEDYDRKIAHLVELYDQLNRTEMARQWRLHLGHVFEFSLNFCEDVQDSERFKNSYELYRQAGDNMRARRAAGKEARRLRSLYANGASLETEDAEGNHRWIYAHSKGDRRLLKEAKKWEQRATK